MTWMQFWSEKLTTSCFFVKKVNDKYMIIDGLHRASLSIYKKKSKLIVLEIL